MMARVMRSSCFSVLCLLVPLGCGDAPADGDSGVTPPVDAGPAADGGSDAGPLAPPPTTLGPADRPAELVVPSAHDGVTPLPAILLLHGYSASGAAQDLYFGLSRAARREGFYVVIPDGTVDGSGNRFWNATPACCDFGGTGVDDVAYLTGLLDELEAAVPVADGQLYLMGHSNGGFMSYRMACERASRVAAIVSLAGSDFANDDDCAPSEPVSVLQIHGDADPTILYGGEPAGAYPSAPDVVARWAERAGCDTGAPVDGEPLDLESGIAGAETAVTRYEAGCAADAELWTIEGGGHIPALTRDFTPTVLSWMRDHAR